MILSRRVAPTRLSPTTKMLSHGQGRGPQRAGFIACGYVDNFCRNPSIADRNPSITDDNPSIADI
jgi:hypothetical protein